MTNAKISKMTTAQLETNITKERFKGDDLVAAKNVLAQRKEKESKSAPGKSAVSKKKEAKVLPIKKDETVATAEAAPPKAAKEKKEKAPKVPKEKKVREGQNTGVSEFVRGMMQPKDGTKVCGCTYGEANRAVKEKFPSRKETGLYPSEFDRNFVKLKKEGVLDVKQPPRAKQAAAPAEEVAAEAVK